VVGACRILLTSDVPWSLAAVALGIGGVVAAVLRDRRPARVN
jgi:hypothetical protein